MASKSELEAIIKLAGKVDPSLRKAMMDANRRMGDLGSTSTMTGRLIKSAFNVAAKGAAIGAATIGVGLMLVAKQGLELASDLTEVQNVVDVTFGKGSKQIDSWAQSALKSYGLGELAAKKYSGVLGALMKSSGVSSDHLVSMSENLTALSGDFASFYNLKTDEAFEKIRAGISGETEPLKALGINMSVANLEAFALSKGIKTAYEKMSQGDKTILRYNYLLQQSADAQGDFARTQDSYANQQRLFTESFKQLSAKIMTGALPAFTALYKKGNQLIDTFMGSPEKIQRLQDAIARAADKAIELIPIAIGYAKDFVGVLGQVYDGAKQVYQFLSDNWSLIKPLLLGIVGAMVAWKVAMGVMKAYNAVVVMGTFYIKGLKWAYSLLHIAKLKDVAVTLYLQSLYAKDAIVKAASTLATWGMVVATGAWNIAAGIGAAVTTAFGVAMAILTSPITLVILAIAALGVGIYLLIKYWDNVIAAMKGAWEWFTNLINKIPDLALVLTGPLAPLLLLIKHFEKVKDIASGAFGAVKKFFGLGGDDNGSVDLSSVPKYARGGFANKPSIFGEAGPEAAIPLKRTPRSLSILSKTAEALGVGGGGGSGSPTFVFAPVYGGSGGGSATDLKSAFEEFKAQCDEWWESKRRESFA
jgi:hypothetical protein